MAQELFVHDPMGGFGADVDVYKAVREKPAMRSVWISSMMRY